MTHLLVTNDFPPKVGGIQAYLWELWRRLPSHDFVVLTSPYAGTAAWDAEQPFRIVRTREPVLLPFFFWVGSEQQVRCCDRVRTRIEVLAVHIEPGA